MTTLEKMREQRWGVYLVPGPAPRNTNRSGFAFSRVCVDSPGIATALQESGNDSEGVALDT